MYHADLPRDELKATFPQITHFCNVSAATGDGIGELIDELHKVTVAQDYMGQEIPNMYLDLEKYIQGFDLSFAFQPYFFQSPRREHH